MMKTLPARIRTGAMLGMALGFAGCAAEREKPGPAPVTCRVERRTIVESRGESGILEAHRVYAFYPDVGDHKLAKLHVREGDRVRKGDLLFEFDPTGLDAERRILQAQLHADETRLALLRKRRTGIDLVEARQRLVRAEQERKEAARALDVKRDMADLGLASAAERDRLEARLRADELGETWARLQLEEMEAGALTPEMAEIEARILQHRNALRRLEERDKDFAGLAPFDGRIVRINDTIKNLSPLAGDVDLLFRRGYGPLLILADTDSMRVLTRFFERDVARLRVGQTVRVTGMHVPGKVFEGVLSAIGELGDTLGETTTVSVEAMVRNENNLLKPGLKVETTVLIAEATNAPAIPVEFLRGSDQGAFVWRLNAAGERERAAVVTGRSDGQYTEVVDGLREGDVLTME